MRNRVTMAAIQIFRPEVSDKRDYFPISIIKTLIKRVINRLIKQGYKPKELIKNSNKLFGQQFQTFHKFCDTAMSFTNFVMYSTTNNLSQVHILM